MTAPAAPALSLEHVTLVYDQGTRALDDVSLSIAAGERVCVLGANGSGKSTLASVLCGLLAPDTGTVDLVGERVLDGGSVDLDAYRRARHGIGLVFQNPDDQIVTTVVAEDVAFGPENLGVPSDQIGLRVARELHRVALDDYAGMNPARLSGGQKQRVAIAGALAMERQVLVLDEPGALLDVRGRRSIMHVMDRLHAAGTTLVHITHFMDEALAADRVIVMDHGRIALEGTPDEVFSHGDKVRGLSLEMPFAARLSTALRDGGVDVPWTCDENELRKSLAGACAHGGQAPRAPAPHARGPLGEPVVTCEHVGYSYSDASHGREALSDVSLSLRRGTTCAIVGQTGSGKSTLLRLVCALEVPDVGRVTIDGISTEKRRERRRLRGVVGFVMQHPERQLFARTVLEDVSYGPRNMRLPSDEADRRVERALALVGLSEKAEASPFELSGGQRRLCAIAGILAMEPRILVLDEPNAGLDPHGRAEVRRILAEVKGAGVTVVQVTHSMEDAATCDEVVVLNQSRLLMHLTPDEVFSPENEPLLRESGLGLPAPLRFALALEQDGAEPLGDPLTEDELVSAITGRAATSGEVG
ncbi:MAG: ABC transporter ATP-binding protein [Olsenella sp.]